MKNNTGENELVIEIQSGCSKAFRTLVEQYQNHVLNTCYRFVLNREDAEDIAQEVFVEVYRSISRFKGKSKLSTWIYRIAVNKSLDFIRKEKRKKRSSQKKESLDSGEDRNILLSDHDGDPEQSFVLEEDLLVLRDAVNRLPEKQQVVFTLSKYDDINNKEIADIMGITLSSVESLMHRAKVNLRKKLFSHFKKDLKKGIRLLVLIFVFFISQMLYAASGISKIKTFRKFAQDNYKNNVQIIGRGIT